MEELVSIIIPAYQEGERIERCLRSIFSSSYHKIEVIIVNDGSTDNIEETVENFRRKKAGKGKDIKLFTIPKSGVAYARNYGLRRAKGEIIGFADADDMIHPQMIEKLVESMRRGNDLAACGLLLCDENGRPKRNQPRLKGEEQNCPRQALEMIMWDQIIMSICTALFRREKIIDGTGELLVTCPENVPVYEDFAFICEYISHCTGKIEMVPFRGYFYCKRRGSLTDRTYSVPEMRNALDPIFNVGERMNDDTFIAHKLQYAFRFMAFWYEKAFLRSNGDFSPDTAVWKECREEIEKFADVYMKAPNVAFHRKIAMWIARKHPKLGLLLAKAAGKLFWRKEFQGTDA